MKPIPHPLKKLFPDHLADLRKSGLTDAIIRKMGVYSVPKEKIAQLLGWNPPRVQSALAFPYPGTDGFVRFKLFPPYQDKRNHTVKYLQPKKTPPRLYVLPTVEAILTNPTVPLAVAEGEKKTAALVQAGVMAVGVSGVWAWSESDTHGLIAELNRIAWAKRKIEFYFDSDIWHRTGLLQAVYAFGNELKDRGADINVVMIEHSAQKAGIDDFLVGKDGAALSDLERIPLTHATFNHLKPWWKSRKSDKQQNNVLLTPVPKELEGQTIHPALHFSDNMASVGVVNHIGGKTAWSLLTSSGKTYAADELIPVLTPKPLHFTELIGRWPQEDLQSFLHGNRDASLAGMAALLLNKAHSLFELKSREEFALLATWAIATYFHSLFHTFPRLAVTGERGSGKSKLQAYLAQTCFNGLHRVNPTPAVLFRLVAALRPTLCLDEIESLASEDHRELLAIINSGYKQGGAVDRCEGEEHRVVSYPVYSPMSLAGIKGLNAVTEDRAIVVVMQRGQDIQRLNAQMLTDDTVWGNIRALGYRLALMQFQKVRKVYESVELPNWLVGRERELWTPLFAIGALVDEERQLGICDSLRILARSQAQDRDGLPAEAEALLRLLEDKLGKEDSTKLRPVDLCMKLAVALHWNNGSPSPVYVGNSLRRLGFEKANRGRIGKDTGSVYVVTRQQIAQIRARYLLPNSPATLQQETTRNNATL